MRTRLALVVFACVAAAVLAVQTQEPARDTPPARDAQQPTFRAGANYVRVDMYATRNGVAVDDLRAEDLELREDGVLQKIESFEHVRVQTRTPTATRVEPSTVEQSRAMAADPRSRVFIVFLDTLQTQVEGAAKMRAPLTRFLERTLGPDDMVAVMTPHMSARDVAFTRRPESIERFLQDHWDWGQRNRIVNADSREDQYEWCYPPPPTPGAVSPAVEMKVRRREQLTLDALDDLVTVLGGLREERKAVLTVSEGWMLYRENQRLADPVKDSAGGGGIPPPEIFGRGTRPAGSKNSSFDASAMAQCEADRLALAHMDNSDRLRQLGERANRGNVSFYTVDAHGLTVFDAPIGPDPPPPLMVDNANLRTRQQALRFLAEETDATAIVNTNQIDAAIDRIVSDLSSYYLFGYYSTNAKLDGKFRTIAVKVSRPGVQVRARRGYRALTANEMVAPKRTGDSSPSTPEAIIKAIGSTTVNPRAPFHIRTSSWASPASSAAQAGHVWIVGEIDARTRRELAWSAGAKAEVTVVAADGTPVLSTSVDMPASDGSFAVRVPESGAVAPGEYSVRIRLRPQADGSTPLTDTARVQVSRTATPLGEAVLWRRGPTTGVKYMMTADPRFTRTERLRLELPTSASAPATARLLERSGKLMAIPVQVSERTDASADIKWVVVDIALAPLAAGDYAVEVSAGDAHQVTGIKIVP